jgi:hypothetical protein
MNLPASATVLIAISGWAAALFLGLLELPGKVNAFFEEMPKATESVVTWWKLDKDFTGTWTSNWEGIIGLSKADQEMAQLEGGPVVLKMRVWGGEMEGEIVSEGLRTRYVFSRIMLRGEKRRRIVEAVAFDYVGGEPTGLARFQLSLLSTEDGGGLHLKTLEQADKYLPVEAKLYRNEEAMPDDLGELNPDFFRGIARGASALRQEPR